jgi:hypothetical protein
MHDDDPQIHLSGKVPGAGTPVIKSIAPVSTVGAAGTPITSASEAIAAATAGSTTDTTGNERKVLRSKVLKFIGTPPLSYCRLIQ